MTRKTPFSETKQDVPAEGRRRRASEQPSGDRCLSLVRVSSHHQKTDSQEAEIKKWLDGNGFAALTVPR